MDKLDMFNSIRMLDRHIYVCIYVCASTLNTYLLKIYRRKYYENEMNKFHFLSHSWQFANYFRWGQPCWVECVSASVCLTVCLSFSFSFSFCITPSLCLSVFLAVYVMSLRVWSDVRVCLSSMRSPSPLASVCISIE